MTLNEFKAWLEGLRAGLGDKPMTPEIWASIQDNVSNIYLPGSFGVRPPHMLGGSMTPPINASPDTSSAAEWLDKNRDDHPSILAKSVF